MAGKLHNQAITDAMESLLQLATIPSGTVQLRYLSGYTPNADNSYWSDISSFEASGAPTETPTPSISYDTTTNQVRIDFTDVTENNITTNTNGIAIILWTGVASTSPIIYTTDITQLQPTDGTLSITFSATGLFGIDLDAV
jgi:hypothetical protein